MNLSALTNCYCLLKDALASLQAQVDAQVEVDDQTLALAGNILTLSGGLVPDTSIDLTAFLDNTDDQVIAANLVGTDLVLSIEDGNTVTVPLASINTDDQTLTLAGTNLSIEDGNTIDLSPFLDNTDDQQIQTFAIAANTLTLTLEDGGTVSVDLSPYLDNTDDQVISLVGNVLTLEDGGTVNLSTYLDDTNAWDNESTTANADGTGGAIYHTGDVGIGHTSAQTVDDDLHVLTNGGRGITIENTGLGQTSPFLTFKNPDNTADTVLTPRDGSALNIEYGADTYLDLEDSGRLIVNEYGSGAFTGTPTFDLQVTASGIVVEVPVVPPTPASTFSVQTVGGETVSVTHNGTVYPIVHPPAQTLTQTTETIYPEAYAGRSANGTTSSFVREATMTRTALGRWQVRFVGAHPDGANYTVETQAEEQSANRDTPDITIVQGTQNASGFDIQITTGDNGGGADAYVDTPWSWGVEAPITVVTGVTLV